MTTSMRSVDFNGADHQKMIERMLVRRQQFLIVPYISSRNCTHGFVADFGVGQNVVASFTGNDVCLVNLWLHDGPLFGAGVVVFVSGHHIEILLFLGSDLLWLQVIRIRVKS